MNSTYKKILIKTKRQVFSEVMGNNASLFLGEGYDFAELREYQIGDDIRKIDWIISAKLQRPYVKLFHAERELQAAVVTMMSGGQYFGSTRSKQEVSAEVASILAFSAAKNSDLFSHFLYADELYHFQEPSKRIHSVQRMVETILGFDPLGKKADYEGMAKTLFKRIKRKSLIFIIGDFLEEVDFRVLSKKHEVILIIVRDRIEENPPEFGFASLVDPESGKKVEGNLKQKTVDAYKRALQVHDRKLYQHCREQRIRFTKIYTDEEPFIKLLKLFSQKR